MTASAPCRATAARASLRLALATFVLAAGVSAALALPGASHAAGSATIALDMDPATPGIQASVNYPSGVSDVYVDALVQNADQIGAFEFEIAVPFGLHYIDYALGPFLGSTGRPVLCQQVPAIPEGRVRIGCATTGLTPPGPSGDGLLVTLHFRVIVPMDMCLFFYLVETADVDGTPLPTTDQPGCFAFTFPPPTATPTDTATATPPPASTLTPHPSTTPERTATAGPSRTAMASRTPAVTRTTGPNRTATPFPSTTVAPEASPPPQSTAAATQTAAAGANATAPVCGPATCDGGVLSAPPIVPEAPAGRPPGHAAPASALPGTGDGRGQTVSNFSLAVAFIGMVLIVVAIRLTFLSRDDD